LFELKQAGVCRNANPHKKYTVEFLSEMGKSLKSNGRILILPITQLPMVLFQLGEFNIEAFIAM